jgi:hypothetical protein
LQKLTILENDKLIGEELDNTTGRFILGSEYTFRKGDEVAVLARSGPCPEISSGEKCSQVLFNNKIYSVLENILELVTCADC